MLGRCFQSPALRRINEDRIRDLILYSMRHVKRVQRRPPAHTADEHIVFASEVVHSVLLPLLPHLSSRLWT